MTTETGDDLRKAMEGMTEEEKEMFLQKQLEEKFNNPNKEVNRELGEKIAKAEDRGVVFNIKR